MKKFIVFCTRDGDIHAVEIGQAIWKYLATNISNIVMSMEIGAHSPQGALISDSAYPIIQAAQTHRNLSKRGF